MSLILTTLTLAILVVAVYLFLTYTFLAPWWQTYSGRAVWALYLTSWITVLHFVMEGRTAEGQDDVREAWVLGVLLIAFLVNAVTVTWKQIKYRGQSTP